MFSGGTEVKHWLKMSLLRLFTYIFLGLIILYWIIRKKSIMLDGQDKKLKSSIKDLYVICHPSGYNFSEIFL